jgi:hypothetical protein
MRKIILLVSILSAIQSAGIAQLKARHFWPATTPITIKNFHLTAREKEGYINNEFRMNECLEGNCDNGTGIWAVVFPKDIDFRPDGYLELTVTLYKGSFSDNGKKFNGKIMRYSYFLDGSGAKSRDFYANKFTPRQSVSLAEDMVKPMHESAYIIAEGEAIFDSTEYTYTKGKYIYTRQYMLHGTGATRDAMLNAGASALQGKYERGQLQALHAEMKENFPAKSFTGRMDGQNNILVGRLEYKDGTVYEGFFRNNNYFGPGRLTMSNGKILQGYWEKGRLRDSLLVNLPASLWDISGNVEAGMKETSINLFGAVTKGKYTGDTKNAKPDGQGFFMTDLHTWYAGGFVNGEPSGAGYYYQFKNEEKKYNFFYRYINIYSGIFSGGYLADGLKQYDRYEWPEYKTDPRYNLGYQLYQSSTQTGTFKNNLLHGCGEDRYIDHRYGTSTRIQTGSFENGQLRGWGTIEQPGVNVAGKLKKFTGYFPEKPLLGFMNERTDLLGYSANTVILGNTPEYYTRFIKDLTQANADFKKELNTISLHMQSCPSVIITEKEKREYITQAYLMLASMENNLAHQKKSGPPKVFTNAECAANSVGAKFGFNQVITEKGTGKQYIVLTYYCMSKEYSLYPFDRFISDFKGFYGNSSESGKQLPLATVMSNFSGNGYFSVCQKCVGTGHAEEWVRGGNEGGWEKWTDNVYYNRPSTAYAYRVRVACGHCDGKGWWVR